VWFVYRIPDGRVFPVPIDEGLRREVRQAMIEMREMISDGCLPEPTDVRKRCEECEYAKLLRRRMVTTGFADGGCSAQKPNLRGKGFPDAV